MAIGRLKTEADVLAFIEEELPDYGTLIRQLQANAGGAPVGSLVATGRSAAPSGWLLCDGAAVSRNDFDELFDAIGTAYGVGDGSTTFNLPDLRGRVVAGVDGGAGRLSANNALGNVGGLEHHVLTTAQIPDHEHTIGPDANPQTFTPAVAGGFVAASDGSVGSGSTPFTGSAGGGEGHNNLQPYQVVNWIVKA